MAQRILALGGGGFSELGAGSKLDRYLLELTGKARPKVCFLPTASGDSETYVLRFFEAFTSAGAVPSVLRLFRRTDPDVGAFLCEQDAVIVGGGNTANMLSIWRRHGVDVALRQAWDAGVLLSGLSAGSLCWFEAGITDSFGPGLDPLPDGLGFLAGSHCPHFDSEALRRPRYLELVKSNALPSGLALDEGVAALFEGTQATDYVSERPGAKAWWVTPEGAKDFATRELG